MLDFSKYDDLFESWEWSVNEETCEYEDIIKNIPLFTEKTVISGEIDSWGYIGYDLNFGVSISIGIKYKTIGDESGWLISGNLSSECYESCIFNDYDDFEELFANYAEDSSIHELDASTDENCSYSDMTLYPTLQDAIDNLNLPLDEFMKRLSDRCRILGSIISEHEE